jgi:hypothetical protein
VARLAALGQRFPTRELEVHRLYVQDEEFRAVCDDYEEALRVLRHWQFVERNVSRAEEYRQIAAELEAEILALLDAASVASAPRDDN